MKVIKAEIQNFKRIKVAEITPAGGVVEVTGKNAQGKSSILDAIEAALGGGKSQPDEPIRRGEDQARVVLDLGDIQVERVWGETSDKLIVKNSDGARFGKAQAKLNELVGGLAFDPLAFLTLSEAKQRETLLELVGVDLETLEDQREAAYAARRDAKRDMQYAQHQLDAIAKPDPKGPKKLVSVYDLTTQLSQAQEVHRNFRGLESDLATLKSQISWGEKEVKDLAVILAEKRADLKKAKAARTKGKANLKGFELPNVEAIQNQLAEADGINEEVRRRQDWDSKTVIVKGIQKLVKKFQKQLDTVGAAKEKALAAAEMPVEGLGVTEDGVTFRELPLSQASTSEQVAICTAICAALNPTLRIALIRGGNDLDEDSLKAFYAHCREAGIQAWVERISGVEEGSIVIEDGSVKT